MNYFCVKKGTFLCRPNRFIAHVEIDGKEEVCHVKNTGRCAELLQKGVSVYLEKSSNPTRKTAYDLIAVEKGGLLINMDSQAPNAAFAEYARIYEPKTINVLREYTYGQSRLDFCLETPEYRHFVEIKGVTLEEDGHALFPDAPTERGIKHLHELMRAVNEGHKATAFFVVQMHPVLDFAPNDRTHKAFGDTLRECAKAGVNVRAYTCQVTPDSMKILKPVPVIL